MSDNLLRYEEMKKEFKKTYDVELSYSSFLKIIGEETRAKEVQKEASGLSGSAYSCEESNAKCVDCSAGLSYLEHSLYGNRCVFCKKQDTLKINLFVFLARAYLDWIIYQRLVKILLAKGQEGKIYLCGCLGVFGFKDVNQVKTCKQKRLLINELDYVIKGFTKG